jgi:hypothetical protein
MKQRSPNVLRERGIQQRTLIIESLTAAPKTITQLCAALGMGQKNARRYLDRLRTAPRQVFICGHEQRHGRPAPIFAAGDKPDVEYVPLSCPAPKVSAVARRQQVLKLLTERPRTRHELAKCMHMVTHAAGRYVTELRRPDNRQLYIIDWRHPSEVHGGTSGGDWTPVYAVGVKKDKRKPVEGKAARHARLQKSPAYREDRNIKRRTRYVLQKVTKKKQGIFAALGL